MNSITEALRRDLCDGMSVPNEMGELFDWIVENEFSINGIGHLGDDCPTRVEFYSQGNQNLHYWFGHNKPAVINRLCVFCQTGGDGSMGAIWLDNDGKQKFVHLGSGSGSTMVCILSDNFKDFMRLLSIGYDEICWEDSLIIKPKHRNQMISSKYYQWATTKYHLAIPNIATEIVKSIDVMSNPNPKDEFNRWVQNSNL